VRAPDGRTFGPYALGDIRVFAAEGRIVPSAVLIGADGAVFALAQFGIAPALPYSAYAPVPERAGMPGWAILLIALAVLIPVLAVVAAVFFPIYTAGHYAGNQTAGCQANLLQLSLGLHMYCQDYDERFALEPGWRTALYPYVKSQTLFECSASGLGPQSYAYPTALGGVELAKIPAPNATPMVYDAGLSGGRPGPHNGNGNLGFVDGHVKQVTPPEFALFNANLPAQPSP
jgi:prepilin-type processing-associated H-X9-DG protein